MRNHRLIKLLTDNRKAPRKSGIAAEAATASEETVYLYDVIVSDKLEAEYFGGVAAENFVKELRGISAQKINLRVNSPGGDVFAAQAIAQAMREHPSDIVVHVDGYAASAASVIAMAADSVIMAEGAFIMIHKAWTFAYGNANDFMDTAALLEKIDNSLIGQYANRTGQDPTQIDAWMEAETWFSAEESVQYGFANSIAEAAPKENKAKMEWNLEAFEHAPAIENKESADENSDVTDIAKLKRKLELALRTA